VHWRMERSRDGPSWSSREPYPAGPAKPAIGCDPELAELPLKSMRMMFRNARHERSGKSEDGPDTSAKRLRGFLRRNLCYGHYAGGNCAGAQVTDAAACDIWKTDALGGGEMNNHGPS
jgi:hypothetical protein